MKVVGLTSQSEAYIIDNTRPIRINEYLKILDPLQGDLICETTETHTYNRFMPLDPNSDMADKRVLESMKLLGYDIDSEKIYFAKVRLLNEASYPIETGSEVVTPTFDEVKNILITTTPEKGLVLGAIKNTDDLYDGADDNLKDLFTVYQAGEEIAQDELPLLFDLWKMKDYPHIGIFGGSGSGKSYGLRVMIEELMRLGIPTIIADPHNEMTFVSDDNRFDNKYNVFQVGVNIGIDFKELSPLDLNYLIESRSGMTEAMKSAVEDMLVKNESKESFINKLNDIIDILNEGDAESLLKLANSGAPIDSSIKNRVDKAKLYERYLRTANLSVLKGISWRFNQLNKLGIFDAKKGDDFNAIKAGKTVVIEGNKRELTVYMSYIIKKMYELRRNYLDNKTATGSNSNYFPPFVIIIDEAHNFAPRGDQGDKSPAKSIIREIAQEGRKYGVFLILATQRPSILDDTSTAQLNSKFLFRTTRDTDIKTIREETDISSEEAARLPYLKSGDVFYSSAIMGRTMFLRIRSAISHQPKSENPFDELIENKKRTNDKMLEILQKYFPIGEMDYPRILSDIELEGVSYSVTELNGVLDDMVKSNMIDVEDTVLGRRYICKK
ncbi:MAG: ATP-binding protein [Ezakiella sp.]|nr:ATP-binding protein [Ezakiella sp.]